MTGYWGVTLSVLSTLAIANPYPDPSRVPVDKPWQDIAFSPVFTDSSVLKATAVPVLRFDVDWSKGEQYRLLAVKREDSGTDALALRAIKKDRLGSYQAELLDARTEAPIYFDSIGTGHEFRKLTRAFTFRFPVPDRDVIFRLTAENPATGLGEVVLQQLIIPATVPGGPITPAAQVALIKPAKAAPALKVNFYAEGYTSSDPASFLSSVNRAISAMQSSSFPELDRMEFWAVYQKSNEKLGEAKDLGMPIPVKNTFLGLYFPYWNNFGRWYHIVYPTREQKFRDAIASAPYDYPIVLVDDREYWGVGNFNELTAIPAGNGSFTYLLLHEFGHYFGLNEEYEGGGATELAFAPGIDEPWSQNITFHATAADLKWKHHVSANTPIPTSSSHWQGSGPWGAYRGGYADTAPLGKSHKPGMNCTMKNGTKFCPICQEAITRKVQHDLGN